jgi:hypothetical protein
MGNSSALARKPGKTTLPFVGPNHSEFIHSVQVLKGKYDPYEI